MSAIANPLVVRFLPDVQASELHDRAAIHRPWPRVPDIIRTGHESRRVGISKLWLHSGLTPPSALALLGIMRRTSLRCRRSVFKHARQHEVRSPRRSRLAGILPGHFPRRLSYCTGCCAGLPKSDQFVESETSTVKTTERATASSPKDSHEESIEERFENFTRVLPWFDFAANIMKEHSERRRRLQDETGKLPAALEDVVAGEASLTPSLLDTISGKPSAPSYAEIAEAALRRVEGSQGVEAQRPTAMIDALCGRWEVMWSGAFSPLARIGFPRQCMWVQVSGGSGKPGVLTCHAGVPLLFGAYLWTSCAGEIEEAERTEPNSPWPLLLRFNRYWFDVGSQPRGDIGRVEGGLIETRLAAFGAALVTPVLLEFGALKWFLERLGLKRVFEVEVPSPGQEGKTTKLEASLELYLTLLAMVAFPPTLSTCPVPYLDVEAGVCVYEIPVLGPVGDLPSWLHPGGNAAALVARRLSTDQEPAQLRD